MASSQTKFAYHPGDVISTAERPLAHNVGVAYRERVCTWCMLPHEKFISKSKDEFDHTLLFVCSVKSLELCDCRHAAYCSAECRTADWTSGHQTECGILKQGLDELIALNEKERKSCPLIEYEKDEQEYELLLNTLTGVQMVPASKASQELELRKLFVANFSEPHNRLLLRLWCRLLTQPSLATDIIWPAPDGGLRALVDLEAHENEIMAQKFRGEKHATLLINTWKQLDLLRPDDGLDAELLIRLKCILPINTFTIDPRGVVKDPKYEDFVRLDACAALYVAESRFNHSCRPNAYWFTGRGTNITIRAIFPIPVSEPITIGYSILFADRETRKQNGMMIHYFDCQCVRCVHHPADLKLDKVATERICSMADTFKNPVLEEDRVNMSVYRGVTYLKVMVSSLQVHLTADAPKLEALQKFSVSELRRMIITACLDGINLVRRAFFPIESTEDYVALAQCVMSDEIKQNMQLADRELERKEAINFLRHSYYDPLLKFFYVAAALQYRELYKAHCEFAVENERNVPGCIENGYQFKSPGMKRQYPAWPHMPHWEVTNMRAALKGAQQFIEVFDGKESELFKWVFKTDPVVGGSEGAGVDVMTSGVESVQI